MTIGGNIFEKAPNKIDKAAVYVPREKEEDISYYVETRLRAKSEEASPTPTKQSSKKDEEASEVDIKSEDPAMRWRWALEREGGMNQPPRPTRLTKEPRRTPSLRERSIPQKTSQTTETTMTATAATTTTETAVTTATTRMTTEATWTWRRRAKVSTYLAYTYIHIYCFDKRRFCIANYLKMFSKNILNNPSSLKKTAFFFYQKGWINKRVQL